MSKLKVSVSVLNGDLTNISETAEKIERSGADMLHFDVMDGLFVDNISFGAPVLNAFHKISKLFTDVHLMIVNPFKYIEQFAGAGADMITFHIESASDPAETIEKIHAHGLSAGLAVSPKTPVAEVFPFLNMLESVLVMSVEPGFGGQAFIAESLGKIKLLKEHTPNISVQVDGGITLATAKMAVNAGADNLVSGSYLLKCGDMKSAVGQMQNLI